MGSGKLPITILAIVTISVVLAGAYMMKTDEGSQISASQALALVMNDSHVSEYMSLFFKVPEWRVSHATLSDASGAELDNATLEDVLWKVELMERSCACSTVKDLYVVEAYVSPVSGEILGLKTMSVLESEYDKKTCASTACH